MTAEWRKKGSKSMYILALAGSGVRKLNRSNLLSRLNSLPFMLLIICKSLRPGGGRGEEGGEGPRNPHPDIISSGAHIAARHEAFPGTFQAPGRPTDGRRRHAQLGCSYDKMQSAFTSEMHARQINGPVSMTRMTVHLMQYCFDDEMWAGQCSNICL